MHQKRTLLSLILLFATTAQATEPAYDGSYFKRTVFVVSDLDRNIALWRDVLGFEVNTVNDYTGKGTYVFELMNIPQDSGVRTVTFNAGDAQTRTMLLVEVPGIPARSGEAIHRTVAVVNANGNFHEIVERVKALGLSLKSSHAFRTADGDDAIEQGFLDWDGNLVLLYELGSDQSSTSPP